MSMRKNKEKKRKGSPKNSCKPWERLDLDRVYPHRKSNQTKRGSTYWGRVLTCPMEHYIGNQWGLRKSYTGDALAMGSVFHWAFEDLVQSIHDAQRSHSAWCDPNDREPIEDDSFFSAGVEEGLRAGAGCISQILDVEGYEEIGWHLTRMWKGLREWFASDAFRWQIVDVEKYKGSQDLEYEVTTRTDATIMLHDGPMVTRWVVELKTGWPDIGKAVQQYSQGFQLKSQVLIERNHGNEVEGVILAYASKQAHDFQTWPLRFSSQELLEIHNLMLYATSLRDGWSEKKEWPKVLQHCSRKYGSCDFTKVCHQNSSEELVRLRNADVTPDYYTR